MSDNPNVAQVSDAGFEGDVLKSDKPVLVDFWAPWCGPCRSVAPVVDDLATQYKDKLRVAKSQRRRVVPGGDEVSGDLDPDLHSVQERAGGGPSARSASQKRVRQVPRPQSVESLLAPPCRRGGPRGRPRAATSPAAASSGRNGAFVTGPWRSRTLAKTHADPGDLPGRKIGEVIRHVVLFAREPARQAREKGFGAEGEDLFTAFAAGWLQAAGRCGARLAVATPPEDRAAWRRRLPAGEDVAYLPQSGGSFGERLESVARRAADLGDQVVLVGGDVAPVRRRPGRGLRRPGRRSGRRSVAGAGRRRIARRSRCEGRRPAGGARSPAEARRRDARARSPRSGAPGRAGRSGTGRRRPREPRRARPSSTAGSAALARPRDPPGPGPLRRGNAFASACPSSLCSLRPPRPARCRLAAAPAFFRFDPASPIGPERSFCAEPECLRPSPRAAGRDVPLRAVRVPRHALVPGGRHALQSRSARTASCRARPPTTTTRC